MLELLATWRIQPRKFDAQALGVTNRQDDPLRWDTWEMDADRHYLGAGMLAVKSARGVGKSYHYGPRRALHFMLCHAPSIVIVTGPGDRVVKAMMDAIVHHWWPRLPPSIAETFKFADGELSFRRNPSMARIVGFSSDAKKREAVKGKRSRNVLIIGDEYSAADEESDRMLLGYLSGNDINRMILFSQPTRLTGPFHRACTAPDSPFAVLTVPGSKSHRVSQKLEENLARTYGRESAVYRCDWLAEFATGGLDPFIKPEAVRAAIGRAVEPSRARPVWGLDPSSTGKDRCPIAIRRGRQWQRIVDFGREGSSAQQVADEIIAFWRSLDEDARPVMINTDAGGNVGIEVCKALERAGLPIVRRLFGIPAIRYQFKVARVEMAWNLKEAIQTHSLPDHPGLADDLSRPTIRSAGNGQVTMSDKPDIRGAGHPSHDLFDALALSLITDDLGRPKTKEAA